jgi:hypothetical protein
MRVASVKSEGAQRKNSYVWISGEWVPFEDSQLS